MEYKEAICIVANGYLRRATTPPQTSNLAQFRFIIFASLCADNSTQQIPQRNQLDTITNYALNSV